MGLEGLILVGAFSSYLVTFFSGNAYMGLLAAVFCGLAMGVIHSFFTITLRADQVVYGITSNIFALGLTTTLFRILFGDFSNIPQLKTLRDIPIPGLSEIPLLGRILFSQNLLTYIAYGLVIGAYIMLYKSIWGLKIRAIGDHPRAADTLGINVFRYRYISLIVGCMFASIGGASLIIGDIGYFMENMSAGRGYVALAAIFFGRFSPIGAFLGALLFGAADAFQLRMQTMGIDLPSQLFSMSPYLITLLLLVSLKGPSKIPNSYTVPYVREE
jgi:simple sugar transport system permease protein